MNKKQFINYCKGKTKDLGYTTYTNTFEEENIAQILMEADIREFDNLLIILPEDTDNENLIAINTDGIIKINTPMLSPIYYALRLEFKSIDTNFYNDILYYWDDMELDKE